MTGLFTALAFLVGAPVVAPRSFAQSEPWRQFREEGARLLDERKYREAEDACATTLKAAASCGLRDPRIAGRLKTSPC